MTRVSHLRFAAALTLALAAAASASSASHPQANAEALFQEGRRLFDVLEHDKAVVVLDQAIAAFQAAPGEDPVRRERLAAAYEMRARSKFVLGDRDGSMADFVLLLKLSPGYTLSGEVSPNIVALFETAARTTVTNLTVNLTPATAKLTLNGITLPGPGTTRVAIGEHVLLAEQPGYRSATETVTATAGVPAEVTLTLERVSSVIRIVTTPPDVEIKIDGLVVGRTAASPDAPAGGSPVASAPFVVGDVANGAHTVELTRECFVTERQRVEVERPDDYTVGPVTLRPAVGSLSITANQPGAQVFVDGSDRGTVPVKLTDVCEGPHQVDVRSRFGSDSRRVDVKAGSDHDVEGVLKPVFAVVSASGPAASTGQDLRIIVERAFAPARSVALIAPPVAEADKALKAHQLTADWLSTDPAGRPLGAGAQLAAPLRKDGSLKLADAFRTQGVASVTALEGSRVVVALLSAGATVPDAVEVALDDPASIAAAVSKLDRSPNLARSSIGLQVIDVADLQGVVVVGVDTTGPAAASGAKVGDIIVQADGKPVTDAVALAALVDGRRPGDMLQLDLRDPAGAAVRQAQVKIVPTPRVISLSEQGVMANRVLLDLRARLAETTDPFEQSVIRLNTAVALARLGEWAAAREELHRVKLTDQTGVGEGTVQYLLGLAAENLGKQAEAEAAFKAAAASGNLMTEDGPAVKELAEARLAGLLKTNR